MLILSSPSVQSVISSAFDQINVEINSCPVFAELNRACQGSIHWFLKKLQVMMEYFSDLNSLTIFM